MRVVVDQLTADLSLLTKNDIQNLVIAYEPVWAIGTGEFATPDQINPVIDAIRHTVEVIYGEDGAHGLRILYGGSVTQDNALAYLSQPGIDGLLVGGASLNAIVFSKIVELAQSLV
jgi:triosephosphate isomerase